MVGSVSAMGPDDHITASRRWTCTAVGMNMMNVWPNYMAKTGAQKVKVVPCIFRTG